MPHRAVSTTCLRAFGGFLICKEDAPTDNIRVELQATVPSPFEDDTVMHANHEACAQESTYPRGRPQSGQLKRDIASFYSVAGVPSVRVPPSMVIKTQQLAQYTSSPDLLPQSWLPTSLPVITKSSLLLRATSLPVSISQRYLTRLSASTSLSGGWGNFGFPSRVQGSPHRL